MRGNLGCERQRRRHQQNIDQVVFSDRYRIKAQLFAQYSLFEHVRIQAVTTVRLIGVVRGQLNAEFHWVDVLAFALAICSAR